MAKSTKAQTSKAKNSGGFIPDEAVSTSSSYLKFEGKDTAFRIITEPVFGYELWTDGDDGKVVTRTPLSDGEPDQGDADQKPKKFMAVVVIDRADDSLKLGVITQQSIIKAVKELSANPKWGDPYSYDINVSKKGEGKKTRYTITPSPKEAISKQLQKELLETPCNLEAIFEEDGNPWEVDKGEGSDYIFK